MLARNPAFKPKLLTIALASALAMQAFHARAAIPPPSCLAPVNVSTGAAMKAREFPDGDVLIEAERGWFWARGGHEEIRVVPLGVLDTGQVSAMEPLPGTGMLIAANKGFFAARLDGDKGSIVSVDAVDTGEFLRMQYLSPAGVLIDAAKGWFLARADHGKVGIVPVKAADTGPVSSVQPLPNGELIAARKGLFMARAKGNEVAIVRVLGVDTGMPLQLLPIPGDRILIYAQKGFFVARAAGDSVRVTSGGAADPHIIIETKELPADNVNAYMIIEAHELPDGSLLVSGNSGAVYVVREEHETVSVKRADAGDPKALVTRHMKELPGAGVLISAGSDLYIARVRTSGPSVELAGFDTGYIFSMEELPGAGVLIYAAKGLFVVRTDQDKISLDSVGVIDSDRINDMWQVPDSPAADVLISAENGLFVTRADNGKVTVAVALTKEADLEHLAPLRGSRGLFTTHKGLVTLGTVPLQSASVSLRDRPALEGATPGKTETNIVFTVQHPCAALLDELRVVVAVTPPGKSPVEIPPRSIDITPQGAMVSALVKLDASEEWTFQLQLSGVTPPRNIGSAQKLLIKKGADPLQSLEDLGKWIAWIGGALLVGTNIALFVAARRSAWAWRIATDGTLSTAGLRLATLALSYVPWAQLWILDLYFQRQKVRVSPAKPFLSLPLSGSAAAVQDSDSVLAAPWQARRTWIEGRSGMGKTALFEHVTSDHFRNHDTAFDAYAAWRCILIPFAARDYAVGGEDKAEPDWVLEAVKGTLSSYGLTWADDSLLKRMLRSGSLAVCIDGLHEAGRSHSVEAFAREFAQAPLFVTSQEPGVRAFTLWKLPNDMRAYTHALLRVLMQNEQAANIVKDRITSSGLQGAIRSGYDLRLVSVLARSDPENAPLPSDRIGLYEAVFQAAWPEATDEEKAEQQHQVASAAWRMVSERKPNEDKRRMKPDIDLPAQLLNALADAPDRNGRTVRLVRRIANAFEFVHDQMHAYLAARWFAQEGLSVVELENMVASSTIWAHAVTERHVLWGFAAAQLDDRRLSALYSRVDDKEEWDVLRRALKAEAERRGLSTVVSA
jgi:hypothetical protein